MNLCENPIGFGKESRLRFNSEDVILFKVVVHKFFYHDFVILDDLSQIHVDLHLSEGFALITDLLDCLKLSYHCLVVGSNRNILDIDEYFVYWNIIVSSYS